MDFSNPATWVRNPGDAFRALQSLAVGKIQQFNARQRQMPVLERQLIALQAAAAKTGNPRVGQLYAAQKADFIRTRSEMEGTKVVVHEIMQRIIQLRDAVSKFPGAGFLGAAQVVVPIAVVVAVLYGINRLDSWISMHDGSVRSMSKALQEVERLPLSPDQKKKLNDYIVEHGGVPNPLALNTTAAAIGGSVLALGLGALLLVMAVKRR